MDSGQPPGVGFLLEVDQRGVQIRHRLNSSVCRFTKTAGQQAFDVER
jgi:hypothetical protein